MFRLFGIARAIRILKILRQLLTLWRLISGLVGALQTMFLGLVMIMMLLMWSIIAIELMHPAACRVHGGSGDGSEWCRAAFPTVIHSTLYFFATLVAGADWGTCAIPIIEGPPDVVGDFRAGFGYGSGFGFSNLASGGMRGRHWCLMEDGCSCEMGLRSRRSSLLRT